MSLPLDGQFGCRWAQTDLRPCEPPTQHQADGGARPARADYTKDRGERAPAAIVAHRFPATMTQGVGQGPLVVASACLFLLATPSEPAKARNVGVGAATRSPGDAPWKHAIDVFVDGEAVPGAPPGHVYRFQIPVPVNTVRTGFLSRAAAPCCSFRGVCPRWPPSIADGHHLGIAEPARIR